MKAVELVRYRWSLDHAWYFDVAKSFLDIGKVLFWVMKCCHVGQVPSSRATPDSTCERWVRGVTDTRVFGDCKSQ